MQEGGFAVTDRTADFDEGWPIPAHPGLREPRQTQTEVLGGFVGLEEMLHTVILAARGHFLLRRRVPLRCRHCRLIRSVLEMPLDVPMDRFDRDLA